MTTYQKISLRIESLLAAELACINAGAEGMAATWRQHRGVLQARRRTMPIGVAATEFDPADDMRNIYTARVFANLRALS
jgi:hypothetical protein